MLDMRDCIAQLIEIIRETNVVNDVLTPLPAENYVSMLYEEVKNLQEAITSKNLDLMALYSIRSLAILAQLLERVLDVIELREKLRKVPRISTREEISVSE